MNLKSGIMIIPPFNSLQPESLRGRSSQNPSLISLKKTGKFLISKIKTTQEAFNEYHIQLVVSSQNTYRLFYDRP